MKKTAFVVALAIVLAASAPGLLRAEEFFITLELWRGLTGAGDFPLPDRQVISIYPLFKPLQDAEKQPAAGPGGGGPEALREDIIRIYRLNALEELAASSMRWDENVGRIPSVVMFGGETFHVEVDPSFVPPSKMKIRLRISKPLRPSGRLQSVMSTELVASLDDPVVTGFSYREQTYFLSFLISKEARPAAPSGEVTGRPSEAPLPVRRVAPRYSGSLGPVPGEGEVVLRVTVDAKGRVTDVSVLKGLREDLDRETAKALKEWTFEPGDGEHPRPAAFAMSFKFRPEAPSPALKEPGGEKPAVDEAAAEEPPPSAEIQVPAGALEKILTASALYCRKLSRAALDFVCEERIAEEIYDYVPVYSSDGSAGPFSPTSSKRLTKKTTLRYDYQLVRGLSGIRESRTLLEENGQKKNEPNAPLKTGHFYSYRSVYGPVGLFGEDQQPLFEYRLVGKDKLKGTKALVVEARPRSGQAAGVIYGKAWVDEETFRILKIETAAESLAGHREAVEAYDRAKVRPLFTTVHLYEVEKNGLLFPSRTSFKEDLDVSGGRRIRRAKAEIEYAGYRYFTVDVTTEIKDQSSATK